MPELPEVETVKNILNTIVKGRKITGIDILRSSTIISPLDEFVPTLVGQTYKEVTRIGKFLIFHFTNDVVMLSHLRMEGKYYELDENEPNTTYSRVVFHLDNNRKLCYDDSRCFGILKLTTEKDFMNDKEIANLGPEPFFVDNVDGIYAKTKKSNHPIKSLITDQSILAGIGNIYADEILFVCKIHPLTPGKNITKSQWVDIVENAKRILKTAIEQGGSTIKSYHPGKDLDGRFQVNLLAYGKYGENCPVCGTPFNFIKVNGRGTTYCPHCQKKIGAPIRVGIFGKIASGKTSVLQYFKDLGYETISSDIIVENLYKDPAVIKQINAMFNQNFKGQVDKDIFREYFVKNPSEIRRINRLIHPLVKEKILEFEAGLKKDICFVEVPLLFESKSENMFDFIIGVDVKKDIQIERLEKRNPNSSKELKIISQNNRFEENKSKADFIVNNDSDLAYLGAQLDQILSKLKEYLNQSPSLLLF